MRGGEATAGGVVGGEGWLVRYKQQKFTSVLSHLFDGFLPTTLRIHILHRLGGGAETGFLGFWV